MTARTRAFSFLATCFTAAFAALPAAFGQAATAAPNGQTATASGLEFKTQRVVIFKDGYGLFVKQATGVVGADGRLYTDAVPPSAVLGTFWATADEHDVVSMTAEWIEKTSSSFVSGTKPSFSLARSMQ